jgi:hypothetical protein
MGGPTTNDGSFPVEFPRWPTMGEWLILAGHGPVRGRLDACSGIGECIVYGIIVRLCWRPTATARQARRRRLLPLHMDVNMNTSMTAACLVCF